MPVRKPRVTTKTAAQAKADKYITEKGKAPKREPEDDVGTGDGMSYEFGPTVATKPLGEKAEPPIDPRIPETKERQKKMGRPSVYSEKIAAYIEDSLLHGRSMFEICQEYGMPNRSTVFRWMQADPAFATRIAEARAEQADLMDDLVYNVGLKTSVETASADSIKLRAFTWRAEHLKPKKYGKQLQIEQTVTQANPMAGLFEQMTQEERDQLRTLLTTVANRASAADTAQRTQAPRQIEGKAKARR